jgi:hypothetical protein
MSPEAQAESEREGRRMIAEIKRTQTNQSDAEVPAEEDRTPE